MFVNTGVSMRRSRNAEMTACSSNIFIIFNIYLSFIFHQSHGSEVIQPLNVTVNPDGSASISCETTANASAVEDVRLNVVLLPDKPRQLCQKGQQDCRNIIMYQENPQKWLFIMLNLWPKAMDMKYECEFTVKENNIHLTEKGTPTILLAGQNEAPCILQPSPSPRPQSPQSPQSPQLCWILIGLLAHVFLYSCVITSFYIRLRCSNRKAENSTYVEMRKAPRPRNPPF